MSDETKPIFNALNDPIPPIRWNLELIPLQHNGQEVLYIHDNLNYIPHNFSLDASVQPLLSLINGQKSILQVSKIFGENLKTEELLSFIQLLDENLLLHSPYFKEKSELIESNFEESSVRMPALAGQSYPENPDDFKTYVESLIDINEPAKTTNSKPLKALYAPHIDLRVGRSEYAEAFSSIIECTPKRVVILATAHYTGYYPSLYDNQPFIGSDKEFKLPGKTFKSDTNFIQQLANSDKHTGFTLSDRAHRVEHSIELHLLYLSAIWHHNFNIVPILISGFDELFYHNKGRLSTQVQNFTKLLRSLDTDDTFYLISGDLSHVGKKFGDKVPALKMREDVEEFDRKFIELSENGNSDKLLQHISNQYDATRVCGFPPLYTFKNVFPNRSGESLNYHWWDETERESAVSFGSILF